jgi:hypothetical protein
MYSVYIFLIRAYIMCICMYTHTHTHTHIHTQSHTHNHAQTTIPCYGTHHLSLKSGSRVCPIDRYIDR